MGEPILLPKFELPGEKTHWAVRLAVISGIVLFVAVGGLGIVKQSKASTVDAMMIRVMRPLSAP